MHPRFGQHVDGKAEIETAAGVGVAGKDRLEPLGLQLPAQGSDKGQRRFAVLCDAPGGARNLPLDMQLVDLAIRPGADRHVIAAKAAGILDRAGGGGGQREGRRRRQGRSAGHHGDKGRADHRCAP